MIGKAIFGETARQGKTAGTLDRDLVLIGGGHAHVEVLRRFGRHPVAGVRLTLITREIRMPYSGMLPGLVAGHYRCDEAHIDLAPLCRFAGARLIHDEAVGLDPVRRAVSLLDGATVRYDVLSIDIGSAASGGDAVARGMPVRPVSAFLAGWDRTCARVLAGPGRLAIGVVGAGAGGVELVLAMRHRLMVLLTAAGRAELLPTFWLFGRDATLLPAAGASARRRFGRILYDRDISVILGEAVVETDGGVRQTGGARFALDATFWVTGAAAPGWLGATGLALDPRGFIAVAATLQSVSHSGVFAAGDVATMIGFPRPKSGVFAVRQGVWLAENLRRAVTGPALREFRPQREALALIGTGDGGAVAARGDWSLEGPIISRWKQSIDRRFMRRYAALG